MFIYAHVLMYVCILSLKCLPTVKALLLILPGFGPEVIFEEEAAMEI
jgi:hypothetical protein